MIILKFWFITYNDYYSAGDLGKRQSLRIENAILIMLERGR